jgi:peptide-methionine (S)-S-oxide reductase
MPNLFRKVPLALFSAALLLAAGCARASDLDKAIPAPAFDPPSGAATQTAVLAGGCFWGQQGLFEHVKGVIQVTAGYSGGMAQTAHYDMVGTETTGHAESVQIRFDPRKVSFGRLLQIYFSVAHDPTELDAQGPDSGPSYRSEIFFANPAQEKIARAYVTQLTAAHIFAAPIVTRIAPLQGFYPAEAYHQDFLIHHPTYPYIVFNDLPKIAALERVYPQYYRARPVTLGER